MAEQILYTSDWYFERTSGAAVRVANITVPYISIEELKRDKYKIDVCMQILFESNMAKIPLYKLKRISNDKVTRLKKVLHIEFKQRIRPMASPPTDTIKTCTTWNELFTEAFKDERIQALQSFVKKERETKTIYPTGSQVLNAYKLTPYDKVRVVILGQDPYHGEGQAHGLAFSTLSQTRPASLEVVFQEIFNDIYAPEGTWKKENLFDSNNLSQWAEQGVLLINSILTVEKGIAGSHKDKGWEIITEKVLQKLNTHHKRLVFMLWGKYAQSYKQFITDEKHLVLEAAHPAAETYKKEKAGFYGCQHFSIANQFLKDSAPFGSKVGITWDIINRENN